MSSPRFWGFTLAGLVLTPPCLALVVFLAAGGHGSYLPAKLLFPAAMLSTLLTNHISYVGIGLAVLQFPIYGAFAGSTDPANEVSGRLGILAVVHSLLVAGCMLATSGSFL